MKLIEMDSKRQMDVQAKGTLYDERELCIFENLRELILLKHRNLGQKGNANLKTVQDIRNHLFHKTPKCDLSMWFELLVSMMARFQKQALSESYRYISKERQKRKERERE